MLELFDRVPHAFPVQPEPESDQVTPLPWESFCSVVLNVCVPVPTCKLIVCGDTVTTIGGFVMVMVALSCLVGSVIDVAVNVTVAGEGVALGAVYVTELLELLDRVPHMLPEQPEPESDQVTPLFWESFCSVVVNVCVPVPACKLAVCGDIVTTIGGLVMVMVAASCLVGSVIDVAISVTVAGGRCSPGRSINH